MWHAGFEGGGDHRPWGLEQRGEEVVEVETALPCGADDAGEDLLGLRATLRAIAVFPPVNDRISSACSSVATKPVVLPWRKWRHTAAARSSQQRARDRREATPRGCATLSL